MTWVTKSAMKPDCASSHTLIHAVVAPKTFDKLSAEIWLADVWSEHCTWLGPPGACQPIPESCPKYGEAVPWADCGCNRTLAAKLDIGTATIIYNNLGGKGPNSSDPREIRYSSGVSCTGEPFELVVTAGSEYATSKPENNGKRGAFGQISLSSDKSTDLKFSFVVPGTNQPVALPEVHMAMFDLDGAVSHGRASTLSKGYTGYVTDSNPLAVATLNTDGRTKFMSPGSRPTTQTSNLHTMTAGQRQSTFMYFYRDVTHFELNFQFEGGDDDDDGILVFALESALTDRCEE